MHLQNKESTNATTATNSSSTADYTLTPVARSYNGRDWDRVAGPYNKRLKVRSCTDIFCTLKIPPISPYSTSGVFYLMSFKNERTFQEELSRLFSQSTFGGTKDMIVNWGYSQDIDGMAQFIKDQMALNITSFREEYRKNVDFNMKDASIGAAQIAPRHPCAQYSRWREHAFTDAGDFGRKLDVISVSGGFLASVDGMPRTIMPSFSSTSLGLSGAAAYDMGKCDRMMFTSQKKTNYSNPEY